MIISQKYRDAETEIEFAGLDKLRQLDKSNRIFLVDKNVFNLYREYFPENSILFESEEENKNLQSVGEIINSLLEKKIDKSFNLTGVGGGITTDISGFTAAIYKRGIKCEFIPTSLIAMCDAAIGGKNGVNSGGFKNQAGTVRHPAKVLIITEFLQTLPEKEFAGGLAEIVKIFSLNSEENFEFLEKSDFTELKNTGIIETILNNAISAKYKYRQAG
jgi:3-dehydroquinate synthetase